MRAPCSDFQETNGLIYFARMLDKIRLQAGGELPPGYFVGVADGTHFDGRCAKFLNINYDKLVERTLQGGSDEEVWHGALLMAAVAGRKKSWSGTNSWPKRGWRDESTAELEETKKELGFEGRADIQTWMDLHRRRRRPAAQVFLTSDAPLVFPLLSALIPLPGRTGQATRTIRNCK